MDLNIWWYIVHFVIVILLVFAIYLDVKKIRLLRMYIKSNEKISQWIVDHDQLTKEMAVQLFNHIAKMQEELLAHLRNHGDSTKS